MLAYAGQAMVAKDPLRVLGFVVLCSEIESPLYPDLVIDQHASQAGQTVFLDQKRTKSACLLHEFLHVQYPKSKWPAHLRL